jgi:DHA2 family multidrug resistance protein
VTRQAQMVAYIDDFKLMMVIALFSAPLLLLLRKPQVARDPGSLATE